MLHELGVQKFIYQLNKAGLSSIDKPASYYGLSLILGGGESTLWELCGAYMNVLRASKSEYQSITPYYTKQDSTVFNQAYSSLVSAYTLKAIADSKRMGDNGDLVEFSKNQTIAWKTGTSFGGRDAWSIGVSGRYVIGVWIGNADGEGRNGLTGIGMASPVMFDLFALLPKTDWPEMPYAAKKIKVCKISRWKATNYCPEKIEQADPSKAGYAPACTYHTIMALDSTRKFRVNSQCYPAFSMKLDTLFVLPPIQEWYFKKKHAEFKVMPPFISNCLGGETEKNIGLIYPRSGVTIYIPKEMSGNRSRSVLEATHREANATLYWHLNKEYIGSTTSLHQIEINPEAGSYTLTIMDEKGEGVTCKFKVVER
jgi:penicillin-binding protein 1C